MNPVLVDTHCHLDQLPEPLAALDVAAEQGVHRVVAVSEDPASIAAVLKFQREAPRRVYAGLGLHPVWVVRSPKAEVEEALALLDSLLPRAALLAEVGLDHKWATTAADQQYQSQILDRQLAMASRCGKPVGLHSRRALRQTMERAILFHEQTGLNAQLHWFTQSRKLIQRCNEAGLFVSVGPTMIDHAPTQEVVRTIADELLLIETDAPVPVHGEAGHPARTRDVAEAVARLKGISLAAVAELTTINAARFLGWD